MNEKITYYCEDCAKFNRTNNLSLWHNDYRECEWKYDNNFSQALKHQKDNPDHMITALLIADISI